MTLVLLIDFLQELPQPGAGDGLAAVASAGLRKENKPVAHPLIHPESHPS
ncbi:hypothetical protein [Pontibacter diazotrophicus]|nr:hypothetical protein [Pontibacter diazotrophicus]